MSDNKDSQLLLDQYKTYNEAKERFIDRNFATNRFYMVLSLVLLVLNYLLTILTPSLGVILTVCAVGMITTLMWWLNIDSYQFLIKVKYAKVLEKIEEMLPLQPYKQEYEEMAAMKKDKKAVVFSDMQKFYTIFIFCIFVVIFLRHAHLLISQLSKVQGL